MILRPIHAFLLPLLCLPLAGAAPAGPGAPQEEEKPLQGTLVPADFAEISLWPEEVQGDFLFLEVLPHGSLVQEGQVVARLDPRALDRQIHDAEMDLRSAQVEMENAQERAEMDEAAARLAADKARAALDRARRALEGWEEHELDFWQRGAALQEQRARANEEDQVDELTQLEAMYREDELVDATEEIVVKRSRRNLAATREANQLAADRRAYEKEYQLRTQGEQRREAVHDREAELQRLVHSQELERRSREMRLAQQADGLRQKEERLARLRHDRELLEIRAPRSGMLLHGAPDDYRPGKVAPRHDRGDRAGTRRTLFTVASSERLAVAVDVPESSLRALRSGAGVQVTPVAAPDRVLAGRLSLERFPDPSSGGRPENSYRGMIELAGRTTGLLPGMRVTVRTGHQEARPEGERVLR